MPKIAKLDPHVADLIAAGEVVERPGSVVKELMENAIDAGAVSLTVEIKNGGMSLIRVTDNGCGIAPEDVETAFLRHATSKLRTEYDLEAIGTLGFRGEALAAIAAVSRISLLTRERGADAGTALELEGGQVISRTPAGCPEGTTITVRDLFFNTPARQKFMKTDKAEGANVSTAVLRCALSHPEISIKYIKDGKEECHTPGDGRMDSCIYNLLGRELAASMLKASSDAGAAAVTGYISSPAGARGNRAYQFFFVNGRFIKSKTLQAALEQAYKNTLFTGRFPACVLYITLSPGAVDVNVHPTKTEVKFLNERQVFDCVYYAALGALNGEQEHVEVQLSPRARASVAPAPEENAAVRSSGSAASTPRENFFKTVPAEKFRSTTPAAGFKTGIPAVSERGGFSALHDSLYKPAGTPTAHHSAPKAPAQPAFTPAQAHIASAAANPAAMPGTQETLPLRDPAYRIIGEALATYILVELEDRLLLIDKHAAHERIIFDRLKAQDYSAMSQALLTPIICDMSFESTALLLENRPLLEAFGFELDAFGERSIAVRQVPADIDTGDIRPLLGELAEKLSIGAGDPAGAKDEILHTVACKAAIKAGRMSEPGELKSLVDKVVSGEVKYCPHGRPVAIVLTRAALDKNFKRI